MKLLLYYALGLEMIHGFDMRPTCNLRDAYETFVCATIVVAVKYSRMKAYVKILFTYNYYFGLLTKIYCPL